MSSPRQRLDVWLHRARLAKTRAAASALVEQGAVRVFRGEWSRSVAKPSFEVNVGDCLLLAVGGRLLALEILALAARRGPPAEARGLYSKRDAEPSA